MLFIVKLITKHAAMPEISRFLGIVISMYFDEHNPPHFHVRYNEYRASVDINTLNIIAGSLPAKVRGLVFAGLWSRCWLFYSKCLLEAWL